MAQNNTFRNQYNPATNWNQILNALPKSQRRNYKESNIAQPNRQMVGTPMYRVLNVFVDTHSPTVGHPWAPSGTNVPQPLLAENGNPLATEQLVTLST